MSSSSSLLSDWSQLPSDLLLRIAETLTSLSDRFRFRGVCHQWRRTLPKQPTPWLLIPDYYLDSSTFLTFPDRQSHKLHIPEAISHSVLISPSPYGWIIPLYLFAHNQTPSLFNPITSARIPLPSLAVPSEDHIRNCKLIAAAPREFVVMVALSSNAILALRRSAGCDLPSSWLKIGSCKTVGDFTFHGGRYFVIDREEKNRRCKCVVIDGETNQEVSVIQSVSGESEKARHCFIPTRFLVESSSGRELYLVVSHLVDKREWFEVFRLDGSEKVMEWRRVRDIGIDVIFLDGHRGMALPASEVDGCRGNNIVFLGIPDCSLRENDACLSVFDLGNGRVEQLPIYWRSDPRIWRNNGWFVPKV